jgi:hypothetical protein
MDLEIETHTGRKVDWNTNDFDLADAIRFLADHFVAALTTLNDSVDNFEALFSNVAAQKTTLLNYSGKDTESNYIEKVENLLATEEAFKGAVQSILKAQKFIKKNYSTVKENKRFIESVITELKKADRADNSINEANEEFLRLYKQDMVKNIAQLQQQAQVVKDIYFKFIKNAASGMSHKYQLLQGKVDAAIRQLKLYPIDLNSHNQKKLDDLSRYCTDRTISEPNPEFSTTCTKCGYSLSDILNYTALAPTKENELLIIQSSFIAEVPPEPKPGSDLEKSIPPTKPPRKIKMQVPGKFMTVQEYKTLLTSQLSALASARADEKIELAIETLEG